MDQFSSIPSQLDNQKSSASIDNRKNKSFSKPLILPKLTISHPNDEYEQEADEMADKVMRMPNPSVNNNLFFRPAVNPVQRKCGHCEQEEKQAQRKENGKEELIASAQMENYINASLGGKALHEKEKSFFEPRMGYNFSNVRLHTDGDAAKSAQSINALAYTAGNNIVFNEGQYNPDTDTGKRLLAHELTHVVQQRKDHHMICKQSAAEIPPVPGTGAYAAYKRLDLKKVIDSTHWEDTGEEEKFISDYIKYCNGHPEIADVCSSAIKSYPTLAAANAISNCTEEERTRLRKEIGKACKSRKRRCDSNDSCAQLTEKISLNAECIKARQDEMDICYNGGDQIHWDVQIKDILAMTNCQSLWQQKCVPVSPNLPQENEQEQEEEQEDFRKRMERLTGLSGAALTVYLIISEGSRIFPPRNLVPVP